MDDIIDCKQWLLDNYTFFDDIFEYEGSYYLDFCLREEAFSFVKLCSEKIVPFSYYPPYNIAIEISSLRVLIRHCEKDKLNQEMIVHPLLKLR